MTSLTRIINKEDIVIEIKRTNILKEWIPDFKNDLLYWKKDIDKLVLLNNQDYMHSVYPEWNEYGYISEKTKKCFILIVYQDNENVKKLSKLNNNIAELNKYIAEKFSPFEYIETELVMLANNIYSRIFIWIEK